MRTISLPATFAGSTNADGVSFSVDGVNWIRLVSLTSSESSATYNQFTFDLSAAAASAGVILSSDTRIKFQQFDNFNESSDGIAIDEIVVQATGDSTPPSIASVLVGSGDPTDGADGWSLAFIDSVDGLGTGAGNGLGRELDLVTPSRIPFDDVDRIYIQFTEPVTSVQPSDIALFGGVISDYAAEGYLVSHVADSDLVTISLSSPFAFDKLRLGVSDSIVDLSGNQLDGDANGVAGDFRFDVIPGDGTGDGRVNGSDLGVFGQSFNRRPGDLTYNPNGDWNADTRVNGSDLGVFGSNFNANINTLADPDPVFFPEAASSATQLAFVFNDDAATAEVKDLTPPVVSQVIVGSGDPNDEQSGWSTQYVDLVDGGTTGTGNGLGIALSEETPTQITVDGVDRIYVKFNEDVGSFSDADFELFSSRTGDSAPVVTSVTYDPITFVAAIELDTPLAFDKIRLVVSDQVTDAANNRLDGDRSGKEGGSYAIRFDVLAGDSNGDGRVNGSDLRFFGQNFGQDTVFKTLAADWNGDMRIDIDDLGAFASNFNRKLSSLSEPAFAAAISTVSPPPSSTAVDEYFSVVDDKDSEETTSESIEPIALADIDSTRSRRTRGRRL